MSSKHVKLIIRAATAKQDFDVDCPSNATIIDIVEAFIDKGLVSETDNEGNAISYRVAAKGKAIEANPLQTLEDAQIQEGDVLLLYPVMKSGDIGKVFFSIPAVLTTGLKSTARVQVTRSFFDTMGVSDEFTKEEVEVELIEVTDVMRCTLEENAIRQHLEIKSHNKEEQFFGSEGVIKWRFDLYPYKEGITNLILKVTATKYFEGRGEKQKDVFFFDKEVLIKHADSIAVTSHRKGSEVYLNQFDEIFDWNASKRQDIIELIKKGEVGSALSDLANISQRFDIKIFNTIVVLQAKLNEIRNGYFSGRIDVTEWLKHKAKVDYATLNLLASLDDSSISSPKKRDDLIASFEQLW